MHQEYIKEYTADRRLRSSLELLKLHILNVAWNTAPGTFSFIFIRLADRALYHATNVWEHFERDLRIPAEILRQVPRDAVINTDDVTSKYEIEAYLGAAKALFEANLIGINEPDKQNLLGECMVDNQEIMRELSALFNKNKEYFFASANKIRNHSYHVNAQLRDEGFVALVKQVNSAYVITIPNVYVDEHGVSIDLADMFVSTHQAIKQLLSEVRDLLLRFFFAKYGPP